MRERRRERGERRKEKEEKRQQVKHTHTNKKVAAKPAENCVNFQNTSPTTITTRPAREEKVRDEYQPRKRQSETERERERERESRKNHKP